jgi:hypothetical protein
MYYTLFFLFSFLGFYNLYNASKKSKKALGHYEKYLVTHPKFSLVSGYILIAIDCMAMLLKMGWAQGVFTFTLLIMTTGFIVITLTPFYYLKTFHMTCIIMGMLILELLIF